MALLELLPCSATKATSSQAPRCRDGGFSGAFATTKFAGKEPHQHVVVPAAADEGGFALEPLTDKAAFFTAADRARVDVQYTHADPMQAKRVEGVRQDQLDRSSAQALVATAAILDPDGERGPSVQLVQTV